MTGLVPATIETEAALEELQSLHEDDATDLVVSSGLALLLQERGETAKARDVLWRSANDVHDDELAAALAIASGMASWQLAERARAVEAFQRAAEHRPDEEAGAHCPGSDGGL